MKLALRIFCCILVVTLFAGCYITRAYRFRKFNLEDMDKFKAASVERSNAPYYFQYSNSDNTRLKKYLDSSLTQSQSYAFLIIKKDSVLYENYFNSLDSTNLFPSFSAAKSFVGTLAQIAHQEGKIKSFSEPVTNYLPWLFKADNRWAAVTIQQVLDMRTGVQSDETYNNPFSDVIALGFRKNIMRQLKKLKTGGASEKFAYKSVNTQILGAIIEAATGVPLQQYLEEKLWKPLGMQSNATWQTDNKNKVRAFCCLNATMHDYAKLGRLYLHHGNWKGKQILAKDWVGTVLNADTMYAHQGYKNHWWSSRVIKRFEDSLKANSFIQQQKERWYTAKTIRNKKVYYTAYKNLPAVFAQGMLGQYIYINPVKGLIIVRMGHGWKGAGYAQGFIERVADMIE